MIKDRSWHTTRISKTAASNGRRFLHYIEEYDELQAILKVVMIPVMKFTGIGK